MEEKIALVYSNREANSNKFYIAEIKEYNSQYEVIFRYGRLGKRAIIKKSVFHNYNTAKDIYRNKINEKIKNGYTKTDIDNIVANDGSFFKWD